MKEIQKFIKAGYVSIPRYLLQNYKSIGLNETSAMILIHIYSELERGNDVFDISKLVGLTTVDLKEIFAIVDNLKEMNYVEVTLKKDSNDKYCEYISIDPLIEKLIPEQINEKKPRVETDGIFNKFEQAFSRPITSVEYQTIMKWIEEGYSEAEITYALKQALYADVKNIRYIDKVLGSERQKNE